MKNTTLLIGLGLFVTGAQAQNTCSTALNIAPGTHVVDVVDGTDIPAPLCATGGVGNTSAGEWYRYAPVADTSVTISTVASGVDTRFHVYSGTCGALVCVAGDDDSGPNFTSISTFNVVGGVVYTIAFDNRWTSAGFSFTLTENSPIVPPDGIATFTSVVLSGVSGTPYAVVDMNGDHLDDVVSVATTNINILRQQAAGGFVPYNYTTTPADFPASWSLCAGDLDGNGYNDLQYGSGGGVTYMLANSDGTGYIEMSFPQYVFSQRGNMVDINNDGDLDAFMCHDVDANVFYMNDGTGNLTFNQGMLGTTCGNYGSIWVDYDNDGDVDLFVAKCGCDPVDLLMRNNGDGTFTSMAAALGLADSHQSWSSAWGDFDNDGDMDILIGSSSSSYHKLMRNNGDGTFLNVTTGSGFDTFGGQSIEWNTRDFNNDGYLDVIGGGAIHYGDGNLHFSADGTAPTNGAIGDLNNDGFLDILNNTVVRMNDGNDNNWLTVATVGVVSNRNGIGARVQVTSALGTQIREIRSGDGFKYMSSLNAHFGIGPDTQIDQVVVYWPSGIVDIIDQPAMNTTLVVIEGLTTGIATENTSGVDLGVFPNPVDDVLHVSGDPTTANARAVVTDAAGKRVLEGTLRNGRVDVSTLTSGAYVLTINAGGQDVHMRFNKR